MRLRFTFLFLVLVAVPLALIAWVGTMLLRQQQTQAREAWMAVIDGKLGAADSLLSEEMTRLEGDFDELLKATPLDDASLYELPRSQPLVSHAFLLDARGKLLFPKSGDSVQGTTVAFLKRTESVWESGVRFGTAAATVKAETQPPQVQQASSSTSRAPMTYNRKADVRPSVKVAPKQAQQEPAIAAGGWHVWFYGDGPRLLFWQERVDKSVVGVEVEMSALLSLLINRLSRDDSPGASGLLQLTSSDGKRTLHQWGDGREDEAAPPVSRRVCSAPLSMWQLVYRPANNESPQVHRTPLVLGLCGAGLGLLTVALMFLSESTREMREARRRVSFVNQVSHELKTPLTNIRLYAEMAHQRAEAAGDETAAKQLSVVEAETSRLSRLIHNVLTFARQQRDQLTIHTRQASLDDVAGRVIAVWRQGLEAKGFQVECTLNAATIFVFDPDAVEQIIGNLLSNVEKYAVEGRFVRITTSINAEQAMLVVEDRGPGVPSRMKGAVFSPFVRVRNDVTEGVSGTGIGLTIARELAILHGGTLSYEDVKEGGARFVLMIPMKS